MAKKILVADDERALVELLKAALETQGLEVITAFNGTEALAKALLEKPDLILLDVLMPGLAGYQVFEKLQTDLHTRRTPVFVISARKNMAELFPPSDLITFVSKPFDINTLMSKISHALEFQALAESKDVLVLGVQDFVVNKIKAWFIAKGYKVTVPSNEYEAIQKCEMLAPKFFLCQFWEDPSVLDSAMVYKKVKYGSVVARVRFYIFCPQSMLPEAQKLLPPSIIVPYTDSRDLLSTVQSQIVR